MTWTYSGNPGASALDQVRFLLGDTDKCEQILQDAEITWVLSQYNNVPINAAIRCCEAVMAKYSRMADESVGQVRIAFSQKRDGYRLMRRDLVNRLATEDARPFAGGISKVQEEIVKANPDRIKPSFTRHMMENEQIAPWVQGANGILGGGDPDEGGGDE